MKTLILWYCFVKKNILPMIITSLMLTISMFTIVTFYGKYSYISYTRGILLDSDLQNGGYMMIYYDDEFINDPETMEAHSLEVRETISSHPACEYILTTDSFAVSLSNNYKIGYNCFLYNENMIRGFNMKPDNGRWLQNSSDKIEGVIIGNVFDQNVGDEVVLDNGICVNIVGIINTPSMYPDFGRYSNSKCPASSLFSNGNGILIISENTVPNNLKNGINYQYKYKNCYVVFKDTSSEAERNDLISYMKSQGIFASYDSIIKDSDNETDKWIRQALPLPMFLLAVCTLSILCICTVVIKRSMSEYSKYYLLGCTKKKSVFVLSMPMILFFGTPCVINLLDIMYFPHFLRAGSRELAADYIIHTSSAVLILIYFAVLSVIIFFIPFLFYRKYSPLTLYRRNM